MLIQAASAVVFFTFCRWYARRTGRPFWKVALVVWLSLMAALFLLAALAGEKLW